eukprot:Opistho-2@39668
MAAVLARGLSGLCARSVGANLASTSRAVCATAAKSSVPSSTSQVSVASRSPISPFTRRFASEAAPKAKTSPKNDAAATPKPADGPANGTSTQTAGAAASKSAPPPKAKGSKYGGAGVWLGAAAALGFGTVVVLGQPEPLFQFEREKPRATSQLRADDNIAKAYLFRTRDRIADTVEFYSAPSRELLLPDPLPEPYQRPYTLVLDLDETLVHSDWNKERGWRTMKRPGLNYFLAYLSQFYEIVIFSEKPYFYAGPILDKIDNQGCIMYRLFKDSTNYRNGTHYKDLTHINRPMYSALI